MENGWSPVPAAFLRWYCMQKDVIAGRFAGFNHFSQRNNHGRQEGQVASPIHCSFLRRDVDTVQATLPGAGWPFPAARTIVILVEWTLAAKARYIPGSLFALFHLLEIPSP